MAANLSYTLSDLPLAALGYHNADIHVVTNRSHSKWVMDIVLNEPIRVYVLNLKLCLKTMRLHRYHSYNIFS
jgi:hypothetical protein